jgi:hypothetical protein
MGFASGSVSFRRFVLRDLGKAIDGLYQAFLEIRGSAGWTPFVAQVAGWIKKVRQGCPARMRDGHGGLLY